MPPTAVNADRQYYVIDLSISNNSSEILHRGSSFHVRRQTVPKGSTIEDKGFTAGAVNVQVNIT